MPVRHADIEAMYRLATASSDKHREFAPKFGLGTVVSTAGADEKAEAHIDFGSEGVKRLLLRYAPVEKL